MADDFSDMEAIILHSAAATQVEYLRPQFPAFRGQLEANGFPTRLPPPMRSSGIQDEMAVNLFTLMVLQDIPDPVMRKQNAALEHNLRNILSYWGIPMLRSRERWKG